jgi:hypothetical protein
MVDNKGIKVFLDDDDYELFCKMIHDMGAKKATYIKMLVLKDMEEKLGKKEDRK